MGMRVAALRVKLESKPKVSRKVSQGEPDRFDKS
jgi:hypothetical protein